MIYLASPYSDPDPAVRIARYEAAIDSVIWLIHHGYAVFSPIVHMHPAAIHGVLPTGWDYWRQYDKWFIERVSCVVVLQLPGWDTSVGVRAEVTMATELGVPVVYYDPDNDDIEVLLEDVEDRVSEH